MKYTVLSVCVGDYFYEAFDITVPSWFKENCERVVVYTDKNVNVPGVEIRPELNIPKSWIEAVGLKADALDRFVKTYEGGNLAFFDMDTYMVSDVSDIFKERFTVAVSQIKDKPTASCGTYYAEVLNRVNCPFRRFAREWMNLQYHYFKNGKGTEEHRAAYDQMAFTDLLKTVNVHYFDGKVFNSRRALYSGKSIEEKHANWKKDLQDNGAKVLHFVNDSWRDKGFVKEMAEAASGFNYGSPS